ncbi:potassium voltage-gated channel protein Shaker [Lingula anatina]|uniref:Potassium voltage-gated channel protein Shaker n=1 Tax=Lingula anatina TaxID=7574 RepID=A0A1S3JCD1_LINAN|nr:potassium voltage-gated channel protein Shaker [Lingula anatina]|eukprot:XP_013408057.1 potassium voltage-gated channel protein Shaker [Lingula anatina]
MANWSAVVGSTRRASSKRETNRIKSFANESTELIPLHCSDSCTSHVVPGSSNQSTSDHDCRLAGCERVVINVSGQYFETRMAVLNRHPDTLLGNPQKRRKYYDNTRGEYFFDRHRPTFEAIFNYYQYGGKLRRPPTVPDDIFLDEIEFYQIEKEILDEYKSEEGYIEEEIILPDHPCLKKVWLVFEYPETSRLAFFVAILSVLATFVSIVVFCVETIPGFESTLCVPGYLPDFSDTIFIIESLCNSWFTVEVVARFIACPNKLSFFKDFKNWVDIAAVVPYYVGLFNILATMNCDNGKAGASLAFLRVIRLVRIFKLTKHSSGLQVLLLTFQASMGGLGLFLVALSVCIVLFSSTIYYLELGQPGSQIESIPDGFWWAVITMCTVGYGDVTPHGYWGKIVGSLCALAGVLTLAIPIPIITENFNKFYTHKTRSK